MTARPLCLVPPLPTCTCMHVRQHGSTLQDIAYTQAHSFGPFGGSRQHSLPSLMISVVTDEIGGRLVVVTRVSRREAPVFTPKKEGVGNEKTPFLTCHSLVIRHPQRPPWRLWGERAHRTARQMYYWTDPNRREGLGADAAKAERLRMWCDPRHDDGGMCPRTWYGAVQIPT